MSKATITLAPGQAGFYDELSGIHLNMEKKQAKVAENANVSGLIRGVSQGKILVVAGSLDPVTNYIKAEEDLPNYYRLIKNKRIKPSISKTIDNEAKMFKLNKDKVKAEIKAELKEEIKAELKEENETITAKKTTKKGTRKKTVKVDEIKEGE